MPACSGGSGVICVRLCGPFWLGCSQLLPSCFAHSLPCLVYSLWLGGDGSRAVPERVIVLHMCGGLSLLGQGFLIGQGVCCNGACHALCCAQGFSSAKGPTKGPCASQKAVRLATTVAMGYVEILVCCEAGKVMRVTVVRAPALQVLWLVEGLVGGGRDWQGLPSRGPRLRTNYWL
jgi:hypothetical protein